MIPIHTKIFMLISMLALLQACSTKEEYKQKENERTLQISCSTLEFPSAGGSRTIEVTSNSDWYVSFTGDFPNWISFSPEKGSGNGSFTVTVGENPTSESVTAKMFAAIFNGSICNIEIKQEAGEGFSIISSNYPFDIDLLYFNNEASTQGVPTLERMMHLMCSKEENPRWLFDGYILSATDNEAGHSFSACSGNLNIAATKDEWLELIEYHCSKNIPLLDQATVKTAELTGVYAHKTKIIFTIPFPSYSQTNWGAIDGQELDFRNAADRIKACKWFIDEAVKHYRAGKFQNVELVGFYWLHEALGMNDTDRISVNVIKKVSDHIHGYGAELYWIPYNDIHLYSTSRLEDWRTYGTDRVIYQPNYFFRPKWDFSRLEAAINKAHAAGVGVEFECDWHGTTMYSGSDRADYNRRAREYITEFDRLGVWDNDIIAYYEYHSFEYIATHPANPMDRELYEMLSSRIARRQEKFYGIKYKQ